MPTSPLSSASVITRSLLIGGYALRLLGSSRYTEDVDYLVYEPSRAETFWHNEAHNIDYVNAHGHPFFNAVWQAEASNKSGRAMPQSLLELKAFALIQYYQDRAFQKADDAEFDIKFLVRSTGVKTVQLLGDYVNTEDLIKVIALIASTRM